MSPDGLRARLAAARGFLFDLDGTLALADRRSHGYRALPGAIELLAVLRERGLPFALMTNGTVHTPASYVGMIARAGLEVPERLMLTPAVVAADVLAARGHRRVLVLGGAGVGEPLAAAGLEVVRPRDAVAEPDAVFVGWYPEFGLPDLEAACRAAWAGAALYSASNAPVFATEDGKTIGISEAICAAVHAVTGRRCRVLGKPSPSVLRVVAERLAVRARDLAVVGDDPSLEVRMARAGGALAIGVLSGLANAAEFERLAPQRAAHAVLPGVAGLVDLLAR